MVENDANHHYVSRLGYFLLPSGIRLVPVALSSHDETDIPPAPSRNQPAIYYVPLLAPGRNQLAIIIT